MVGINLVNNEAIGFISDKTKETISSAISDYILRHWDECVNVEYNGDETYFKLNRAETH